MFIILLLHAFNFKTCMHLCIFICVSYWSKNNLLFCAVAMDLVGLRLDSFPYMLGL